MGFEIREIYRLRGDDPVIDLYTGTVGSGKSFHALEKGIEYLESKKHVVANFPIKEAPKYFLKILREKDKKRMERWLFWEEITPEKLIALSLEKGWYGKESQCLVIIDEAGIMFNSREWQIAGQSRTKWIKFLSQSRKFGYDFVFVAQSDRMIDKQIRGLVEYEVKHYKLSNSFFLSWLKLFKVSLFLYNYKWYQTKVKGNLRFSKFKKSIGDRYDTMRTFDLDELVHEIEKMYSGTIVPAGVLIQLNVWREEIEKRKAEREKIKNGLYGDEVGEPADQQGLVDPLAEGSPESDLEKIIKEMKEKQLYAWK